MPTSTLDKPVGFWQIVKRLFALALPMSGSQFISTGSNFICMGMLAQLGHQVLAASALIFTTQVSIMISGMAVLFSLSVLIGHAYGAKNFLLIGNYLQQGWTLAVLMGIPIMLFFWYVPSVLSYLGEPPQIVAITKIYFHAYIWNAIPFFLSICAQQFGYAVHKKFLMILTSCLSVLVLISTAYLLIFGKFGFPRLGVAGLAYAFVAQNTFFVIFTLCFFYFHKSFQRFDLFKYRVHHNWEHLLHMFKIGWPICVQMGGEMLSFFVSGLMIGWLGSTALGAYQIINQYYMILVVPIFSISHAGGILVGHARGAKLFNEIKYICLACLLMVVLFNGVFVMSLLLTQAKPLASFYLNTKDIGNIATLSLTISLFAIIAYSQFFDAIRNVLIGTLRGLFDTRFGMIASLVTIWGIGMPCSYLLAFPLHYGPQGFVFGGLVGMVTCTVLLAYRWQQIIRRYEKLQS